MFNKSTREVYSNHLYLQMKKHIWYDKIGSYEFLTKSIGGLVFKKEILDMHSNFLIFHFNHIISDRMHHTSSTTFRDHELPEIYYQGEAFELILSEIELISKLAITLQRENKKVDQRDLQPELKASIKTFNQDFLKKYVTDGVLKMLLKYVSGLKYVCFDEKILGTFSNQVNGLSNALSICYDDLLILLDTERKEKKKDGSLNQQESFNILYLLLMKFSLRKTPQCLIQAEQNAQKNNSALYLEDYMNQMSDDEAKLAKRKTSNSGIIAELGEARSQIDGSVEMKDDTKDQTAQKDGKQSYLGHVLLQGFMKNSTNAS